MNRTKWTTPSEATRRPAVILWIKVFSITKRGSYLRHWLVNTSLLVGSGYSVNLLSKSVDLLDSVFFQWKASYSVCHRDWPPRKPPLTIGLLTLWGHRSLRMSNFTLSQSRLKQRVCALLAVVIGVLLGDHHGRLFGEDFLPESGRIDAVNRSTVDDRQQDEQTEISRQNRWITGAVTIDEQGLRKQNRFPARNSDGCAVGIWS